MKDVQTSRTTVMKYTIVSIGSIYWNMYKFVQCMEIY